MSTPFKTVTLSATGYTLLARAGENVGPEGWLVRIRSTSWTGSIVLVSQVSPPGTAVSYSNVAYQTGGTWAAVSAGIALTANGSVVVAQTGYDLYANYTHTSGEVSLDMSPASIGTGHTGGGGGELIGATAADIAAATFGANSGEVGAYTFPAGIVIAGTLTGLTNLTFSGKLVSATALATPSALTATGFHAFASAVSGGVLGGFGTPNDVTLMNRAGTVVLGVTANTTGVTMAGALAITGALSGVTTLATSGAINSQTISATAAFTGTVGVTGALTATGGLNLASEPTINPAAGGMWQLATAGTDTACTNGTAYFVEVNIPYNRTATGIGFQVGSVGGTTKVIVTLYDSTGAVLANSALAGETVGTAAEIQSVAFTAPVAVTSGRHFASVCFDDATAKFRSYPIPGSKFIAGSEAETFGTVTAITPGTSFTADKGPLCFVY